MTYDVFGEKTGIAQPASSGLQSGAGTDLPDLVDGDLAVVFPQQVKRLQVAAGIIETDHIDISSFHRITLLSTC